MQRTLEEKTGLSFLDCGSWWTSYCIEHGTGEYCARPRRCPDF